jgi:hypothetical protein
MTVSEQLKTYSVLIAYADHDPEQGEWGGMVCASDPGEAVIKARRAMHDETGEWEQGDPEPSDDELIDVQGRIIEVNEGAVWRAGELEQALRDIVQSSDANDHGSLMNAVEAASRLLASIDADSRRGVE